MSKWLHVEWGKMCFAEKKPIAIDKAYGMINDANVLVISCKLQIE